MNLYVLKNFTLREIYFGICDGDTSAAVKTHKSDNLSPVGHWKWGSEEIKWGEVEHDLHEALAQSFLAALRREPPEDGWVLVVGSE
jgi:hypothetical protein